MAWLKPWLALLCSALLCLVVPTVAAAEADKATKQAEIRKNSERILDALYKAHPSARATIKSAAGYAVFSNVGVKILVAGGGKGAGMAVERASGRETFMKMVEVQAGLGFGVKKFRQVFVFETQAALRDFVESGWEFGGQATAAATDGRRGGAHQGAILVSPGVWVYQLTEKGLALELTGKGTKYYKDEALN